MIDYTEKYYEETYGCYPFDSDDNKNQTQKVIEYLFEAGLDENDMMHFIENAPILDCLTFDLLPEDLWKESLLSKGTFYYHHRLHIISKAPIWDPVTNKQQSSKFSLEMIIKFTMDDLIKYFYDTIGAYTIFYDKKKDSAAFNYLLNKYKVINFIEPIDFIMSCIDFCKTQERTSQNILDLSKYESDVYKILQTKVDEAKFKRMNRIVWR